MTSRHTYIVAEAGVNHNGSVASAHALVDVAADARADAIKFQTFRAERLASTGAPKAEYQTRTTGSQESQLDMLRALELSEEAHHELAAHCAQRRIAFMSTPFDCGSLDWLCRNFDLRAIKISSGDLINGPLLLAAARTGKPVFLSTGMADLEEIKEALEVLAFGYTEAREKPTIEALRKAAGSSEGRSTLRERVTLLQCTTEYPARLASLNLRAMQSLRETFDLNVGFSDHSQGIIAAIAATALGASVIEKHFTLDRSLPGPDHEASLEPMELADLVRSVRQAEETLGDGVKQPTAMELRNREAARKSLVASRGIARGEMFTVDNVTAKRPGGGVSPVRLWELLGRQAARDYREDELLDP